MKRIVIVFGTILACTCGAFAEPTVTDVAAKQRYPWNGLVDITCKVTGINGATNGLKFAVSAVMPDTNEVRMVSRFWVVQGGTNSTDRMVYTNGNYRLVWDASAELGQVVYDNMVVRVAVVDLHGKVQLWSRGPYWADTNIGAENPEDYGCYFWWGDTVGYKYNPTSRAWEASDGSSSWAPKTNSKSYDTLRSEGWITADGALAPEHDAAQVQWGGNWRLPTARELTGLFDQCDRTWTTMNGVNGYVIRGKGDYAANSIFLPAAGYGEGTWFRAATGSEGCYWSSDAESDYYDDGWCYSSWYLDFNSRRWKIADKDPYEEDDDHDGRRDFGQSIRPVQVAMAAALAPTIGYAGDSAPFRLDTIKEPRIAREVESITYSPDWNSADSCSVTVATRANSGGGSGMAVLVASMVDDGVVDWPRPETYGLYTFTHTSGGETQTAQFVVPDPAYELGGESDVAAAFADAVDPRLPRHVRTVAEYYAYRTWMAASGLDLGTVRQSPRAWFSYALDAPSLVERAFQGGDVSIVSLDTASDGSFTFEVDVKDVLVGMSATPVNLASVFEVQGTPTLSESSFSPANVNAAMEVSASGRLLVRATPKVAQETFFARVRMHADTDRWTAKVQLWEGGPYWADMNIGAENPEDYGYYFWWGDTVGYKRENGTWVNGVWVASDGSSSNFSFDSSNTPTCCKSISTLQNEGWIVLQNGTYVLAPEHDAAHVHWGGGWRMPTELELHDLSGKCDWTWTTMNGVRGYVVRGRGDYTNRSIFLPAAGYVEGTSLNRAGLYGYYYGYYWSSVPDWDDDYISGSLDFDSDYHGTYNFTDGYFYRDIGQSIRPVQGFTE